MYRYADDPKIATILETNRISIEQVDIPALVEVYDHWNKVRGDKFAPSLREFRVDELPPAVIPGLAVVDFLGPPLDYFYRFFGSRMVEIAGMERTGKRYYADAVKGYGFVNAEIFPIMIEERRPIVSRTKWVSVKTLLYWTTTVRLPICADGAAVTGGVTVNQYQLESD